MIVLRRLSNDIKQVLLNSSRSSLQPLSDTFINRSSLLFHYPRNTLNLNNNQNSHAPDLCSYIQKCNFHTSIVRRDIETGLKALGAGLAMIGALGPGIGIGSIFGGVVTGVARNPSTRNQLFGLAIIGTAFCEAISLFCFIISMIIFYG